MGIFFGFCGGRALCRPEAAIRSRDAAIQAFRPHTRRLFLGMFVVKLRRFERGTPRIAPRRAFAYGALRTTRGHRRVARRNRANTSSFRTVRTRNAHAPQGNDRRRFRENKIAKCHPSLEPDERCRNRSTTRGRDRASRDPCSRLRIAAGYRRERVVVRRPRGRRGPAFAGG